MTIKIVFDEEIELYSILINGEVVMECLSEAEVNELSLRNLRDILEGQFL